MKYNIFRYLKKTTNRGLDFCSRDRDVSFVGFYDFPTMPEIEIEES